MLPVAAPKGSGWDGAFWANQLFHVNGLTPAGATMLPRLRTGRFTRAFRHVATKLVSNVALRKGTKLSNSVSFLGRGHSDAIDRSFSVPVMSVTSCF